jgi:peptide deformylase
LIEHEADELFSRAVQHESDHLDGKLFIDHIDPLTRHSHGDKLRTFESRFRKAQELGEIASDQELVKRLDEMARPVVDLNRAEVAG